MGQDPDSSRQYEWSRELGTRFHVGQCELHG
jgi:hypothetical protein